jgi:aryl carrier-like protein
VVPEIPLNANGKVDAHRLVTESGPATPSAPPVVAAPPGDSLSTRIREIWADVLHTPELEETDNFFDVGGHSFALITVQQRMAAAGLEISVTDLFRFGTVAACAAHFRCAETTPTDDLAARRERGRDFARRRRDSRGEARV